MSDQENIKMEIKYGTSELRSWIEFDGEKYIGMGMRIDRDLDGKITDVKIEPTGAIAKFC